MIPRSFTIFHLDEEARAKFVATALGGVHGCIGQNDFDSLKAFYESLAPEPLDAESPLMCSKGFNLPDDLILQMACDSDCSEFNRTLSIVHCELMRDVDAAGIRKKCSDEMSGDHTQEEVEAECQRRVDEARIMSPLKATRTRIIADGSGFVMVAATGATAKAVIKGFMKSFCSELYKDEESERLITIGSYFTDSKRLSMGFDGSCYRFIDYEVFGNQEVALPVEDLLSFEGSMQVMSPGKAKLTIDNMPRLPESMRPFLSNAKYLKLKLSVKTESAKYLFALTPKNGGEYSSVKLDENYRDDEDSGFYQPRQILDEIKKIRAAVLCILPPYSSDESMEAH